MKWINIKDKLPPEYELVLLCVGFKEGCAPFIGQGWYSIPKETKTKAICILNPKLLYPNFDFIYQDFIRIDSIEYDRYDICWAKIPNLPDIFNKYNPDHPESAELKEHGAHI